MPHLSIKQLALLLAALLVLAYYQQSLVAQSSPAEEKARDPETAITVPYVATTVLVQQSQSNMERSFTGTITARRISELGFKQIGRIDSILVDHGQAVRQGELLASLDSAGIHAEMQVVEAQLGSAAALLKELVAGPRQQTIEAARAQLAEALALRNQSRATFDRRSQLINSDAISRQDIDDSKHLFAAAEANVQVRRQLLAELEAGTREERIEAQRSEIARLEATLQTLQVQLDESQIIAPFDGLVARRLADEGTIVQPGQSILRLMETWPVEVWVGLPVETVARLSPSDRFSFTTLAGEARAGVLTAVLPELEQSTRTQTAIFELDAVAADGPAIATQPAFAVGQIIQLRLSQPVETDGYWVPLQAVSRSVKGLWSLFVVVEEESQGSQRTIVRRSDVEILQVDDARVLVVGLVKAGDRIVTAGVQKLTSGQTVQVKADEMPEDQAAEVEQSEIEIEAERNPLVRETTE